MLARCCVRRWKIGPAGTRSGSACLLLNLVENKSKSPKRHAGKLFGLIFLFVWLSTPTDSSMRCKANSCLGLWISFTTSTLHVLRILDHHQRLKQPLAWHSWQRLAATLCLSALLQMLTLPEAQCRTGEPPSLPCHREYPLRCAKEPQDISFEHLGTVQALLLILPRSFKLDQARRNPFYI